MRMKKNNLLKFVIIGVVLCLFLVGSASAMSGSGTADDPYILTTAQDVLDISNNPSAYYELGNDISMSGLTNPQITTFSGSLDGKGFTISNVTNNTGGLFNQFNNVTLTNITFDNFTITQINNNADTGTVVNKITGTSAFSNINVTNSSTINNYNGVVGGFVGRNESGISGVTVKNSYVSGNVTYVSGLIGSQGNNVYPEFSNCKVINCYVENTNVSSGYSSGLVGLLETKWNGDSNYILGSNCDVIGCYISGYDASGLIGGESGAYSDRYGGHCYINFDNFKVNNNLIKGTNTASGLISNGWNNGRPLSYSYNFTTKFANLNLENNSIYSDSGFSSLIAYHISYGKANGIGGGDYNGDFNISNGKFNHNLVYSNSGKANYSLERVDYVSDFTIENSNVYGTTIQTLPSYVTLDNVVNTQGLYYPSEITMEYTPEDEEETTKTITWGGMGAALSVNTSSKTVSSNNDFNDGIDEYNNYPNTTYTKTYTDGTYTATADMSFINPSNLSNSSEMHAEVTFTVGTMVLPVIEDEAATPSTIIQRGTDTVTLSATITAPEGHEITSIQWKQSDDNVTFTDISGATTATYVWTPTVGLHYVKVTATNADGSVDSNVLTVNVYGLATITKDDISSLNVELGSKVTLDGAYTASSNPVPNTYSQWKYSSNGTTWNDLLGKNVNSGEYTCSTSGTFYVRYCVGDDDSGIFSFRNTYTVNVQQAEVITVTASKTEAALNENITLTAVIQHQYQETHKWQSSTDNVTFTDISGETDLTLDITTSTVGNMYYRLVSTNAFGTYTSNVVNIKTYGAPTVTANVVPLSVNVNDTVNLSGTVTVNPTMGDSDYTVKWQYSNNGGTTWTDIVGGSVLNTTTSFSTYGEYKVKLVVTDSYYTINSDIFTVNVMSVPTIESVNVTPLTTGTSGEFTLTSTVTAQTETYSVQWKYKTSTATEWSNVTGGNVEDCTLSGLSVGNYNIKLTASNEYGTVESQTFNVEVVAAPVVTASVDKQSVTVGDTIVFTFTITDTQTGGQADLEVSYDDGEHWNLLESDITSPYSYVVEVSNECIYRIAYSNSFYLVYSNEMPVSGHDLPVISTITLNPSDGKIGYGDSITAQTTVTSDLTTTKRWWYYNVNTPQTKVFLENSNVETYTYSNLSVGEYVIGIEVTDSLGNIVNGTCTTHVKVYGEPSVSLSVSPSSVSVGGSVTLTADVTVNPVMGDSDYSTYFQIKENNVWTNFTSPYTVLAEGTYEFRAVVTDSYFTEYSTSQFVQCANVPVVSGTADASTVSVGSTITLTGSVTSSLPVTSYKWQVKNGSNWNDLTTSPIYVSSYTLSEAGVYTFRFTASNSMGAGYSNEINVTAQEARSITASISSSSVQVGNSVDLSAVVTTPEYVAPIFSQSWEMSTDGGYNWDSMGISSLNTSYTPQTVGVYDFRYKIVDTFGVVSLSNVVSVTAGDIPVITLNVDSIAKVGDVKTFRADVTSLTPLTSTEWFVNDVSIGEGSGAEFAINYTFNEVGTYTVKFVAVNSIGSAYNTVTVNVINSPVVTDFALSFPTLEFGDSQTVHFKSNVSLDQLRIEQKYMTGIWTNTNAQISLIGDTYYGNWNVYTDGSHGGTVYTRIVAVNEVGTTYSDELSFSVNGKAPSSYAEVFKNADKNAQSVMIIAALVMLVIIGILFIGVITGTMDISTAVKAFLIVGGIVIVITFLVVFIGSMSGVITGLL